MIVSLRVNHVLGVRYQYKKDKKGNTIWSHPPARVDYVDTAMLNKNDTYVCIFSPGVKDLLHKFRKLKEINILYEAPEAVNLTYGHGKDPRNTLVIFELA